MRLFIAVEPGERFVQAALAAQKRLKRSCADVKWTEPDSMHFTLHFLGEVPEERLAAVEKALESVAAFPAFEVFLGDAGRFPPQGAPKVLWLGVEDRASDMRSLAELLGSALKAEGFATEVRLFVPHLTLGRVRGPRGMKELLSGMAGLAVPPERPSLKVSSVELIKSELRPEGALYTVLKSVKLK